MIEFVPILVPVLSFAAVAIAVYLAGQFLSIQLKVQRRLPLQVASDLALEQPLQGFDAIVARHFDPARFGLNDEAREKLRRKLLDAGYFGQQAPYYYAFARVAAAVLVPILVFTLSSLFIPATAAAFRWPLLMLALLIGIAGPDFYLARRQRALAKRYRHSFPDLLDLLVICVDAGLSLDAAFERAAGEITKRAHALGIHLAIMGAEMRAGRSMVEALESLADRLHLQEAQSLVAMLRQSIELGSDIGDALRVFSDEMRDKRLLRAEEKANQLSVKMVVPLGLFIFPVVLIVTILPVMIKLIKVIGTG